MIRNTITGTHPVHLHANGGDRVLGWAKAFFRDVQSRQMECNDDSPCRVEIVTCSTYRPGTTALEKSCRHWGVGIVRLTPPSGAKWRNWLRHGMSAKHCEHTDAEWLLFSDASDAIFVQHPDDALDALRRMGRDAIIAAEHPPWPSDCPVKPCPGTYPYGNGGGILGRRELLTEFFREANQHRSKARATSDQYGTRVAAANLHIVPDTEAVIFQTLAFTKPGEVEVVQ